ncbi:MAG: HD domain-containing protein [Clostridia bacterium]|nr:HD domain-containing protein [Clostridia bacterium]
MISFNQVKSDSVIKTYIEYADKCLSTLGYTEHSFAHVGLVAHRTKYILDTLGYSEREIELGMIAAYMHDIGNAVNRKDHSQSGALMAFRVLDKMGMDAEELVKIVAAIGNHDEGDGVAVNPLAAALIISDKSDVRRTRVRNRDFTAFDIHDRVNYSVIRSDLKINEAKTEIELILEIDTEISSVVNYFEIFLTRMIMCRKAAKYLNLDFKLTVNGQQLM